MTKRVWFYHKEYAPTGRIFDMDALGSPSEETLAEQGWVDGPEKIGVNLWGGSPADMQPYVDAVENGEIPRIGPGSIRSTAPEKEMLEAEVRRTHEQMRVKEDENEDLKRQLREANERLADHRSDAAKEAETRAETQVQVPAAETETEDEVEDETGGEGDSDTDL